MRIQTPRVARNNRVLRIELRANLYLVVAAVRNIVMGTFLFVFAANFTGPGYEQVFGVFPREAWGLGLLAFGLGLVVSVLYQCVVAARWLLLSADVVLAVFVGSAVAAIANGTQNGGYWFPIIVIALIAKDFLLIASPIVGNPFTRRNVVVRG